MAVSAQRQPRAEGIEAVGCEAVQRHVQRLPCPPMSKRMKEINRNILEVLLKHGAGNPITLAKIRKQLGKDGSQQGLPRRIRELRDFGYSVSYTKQNETYTLESAQPTKRVSNVDPVSGKVAAEVRIAANGRCQMCGKTIVDDAIKLVVDHRVPRAWGGSSARYNLWAIYEPCNIAKQDFFAAFDDRIMRQYMKFPDPIRRIGELLGHTNTRVTMQHYNQITDANEREGHV